MILLAVWCAASVLLIAVINLIKYLTRKDTS